MRRIFAGVLLASALGCSSSSGGAPGAGDASTDTTGATFGAGACGQCVATACATAIMACNGAPDCATYLSCLDGCPPGADGNVDPTCAAGCPQATSSTGQSSEAQLTTCRTSGAGASCAGCGGSTDGGVEGGLLHESCAPDLDAANGCAKCLHEECCDARLACLNDVSCSALVDCESDCQAGLPDDAGPAGAPPDGGHYSCDEWCNAKTNPGLEKYAQYLTCGEVLCQAASACGGGDTCTACVDTSCATEFVALQGSPDGYLFDECIGQCASGDTTCQSQCIAAYPSVQADFSSLGTCEMQHCPSCQN
ncbi:MAG TPA: hypothetical protein VHS09_02910 [Polyangiaceae bacterium]|jgi:hypothetical protein|nr:hypothetical protein [Polyangiaceae bacterium]